MKFSRFVTTLLAASAWNVGRCCGQELLRGGSPAGGGENPRHLQTTTSTIGSGFEVASADEILGAFIVEFERGVFDPQGHAETLCSIFQTSPTLVYRSAIEGFAASGLSDVQAEELRSMEGVKGVYPDRYLLLEDRIAYVGGDDDQVGHTRTLKKGTQMMDWGVAQVTQGRPRKYSGPNMAWVVDSGIQIDHPDLNVKHSKGYTPFNETVPGVPKKYLMQSIEDHGTQVAGVIGAKDNNIGTVGVAPGVPVVPVRVADETGRGMYRFLIAGLDHISKNAKPGDVVNISLGTFPIPALDEAVIEIAQKGIKVVIAAGNWRRDTRKLSPQRIIAPNVYVVSAIDKTDNLAFFSNFGNSVNYAAPGVGIVSTCLESTYCESTGTSIAAPHLTGALLQESSGKFTVGIAGYAGGDTDDQPDPIVVLHKN